MSNVNDNLMRNKGTKLQRYIVIRHLKINFATLRLCEIQKIALRETSLPSLKKLYL